MSSMPTDLPEVVVLEPQVFGDDRGFFFESWNARTFTQVTGVERSFVQDNHSRSEGPVLRGVHYQVVRPQGKLVRVVEGTVFDVAIDLRRSSTTFLRWVGVELSAENKRQLWIPEGFGHGFFVVSRSAEVLYKATEFYMPEHDRTLRWNDPALSIEWPIPTGNKPRLSDKDANAPFLADAEVFD